MGKGDFDVMMLHVAEGFGMIEYSADFNGAVATVVNMNGETIVRKMIDDKLTRIDINHFAKGIYMVWIQKGESVVSKKISFQ